MVGSLTRFPWEPACFPTTHSILPKSTRDGIDAEGGESARPVSAAAG